LTICLVLALVLGSCSASKKCPAYTQNTSHQTEAVRV
jgi:hypothetical protein